MYRGPKNLKHIKYILKNLRPDDRKELQVKYGEKFLKPAFKNIRQHDVTIVYRGKDPVLMYGVCPQQVPSRGLGSYGKEYIGIVWMLATENIGKDRIQFLKESRKTIQEWEKQYRTLCNIIYKGNSSAISWLKWLGFQFKEYNSDFDLFYKECS